MNHAYDYVNHFYKKYEGRVAIGVGYNQDLSEIYPFVFEDSAGNSIGVVALGVYSHEGFNCVHIYHIGSFKSNRGNGTKILQELCLEADKHRIILSLSPIPMPSGKNESMSSEFLRKWYGNFGFKGRLHFSREPGKI
jgi:hypothetical protein